MLHHIQKDILDLLSTAPVMRYGELKPNNLEGNVFNYHLKQLVTAKYVDKNAEGEYILTSQGKNYIIHRYEDPLLQAHSIFLIVIKKDDKWLLRERLVQPLLGMSGFIHGEPIANEPLLETAARRLQEKTGLAVPLSVHGSGLVTIFRGDTLESFSHAIIITGQTKHDFSITGDQTGRNHWLPISYLQKNTVLPSCSDIITLLAQESTQHFELSYRI